VLTVSERHQPLQGQIVVRRLQLVHNWNTTRPRLIAAVPEDVKEARIEALEGRKALQIQQPTWAIHWPRSGCHGGRGSVGPAQEQP
jgi:hypothetical protein